MKRVLMILGLTAAILLPAAALTAQRRVVIVRPHYFYGGFYRPFYDPFWEPYPYAGPYYVDPYAGTGTVKLHAKAKDAQVFVNGSYAGTTRDNKTMHLRPGSYNIEIRDSERTLFSQSIYVSIGKKVDLYPAT